MELFKALFYKQNPLCALELPFGTTWSWTGEMGPSHGPTWAKCTRIREQDGLPAQAGPSPRGTPGSSSAERNAPHPLGALCTFFSSKVLCPGPVRSLPHPGLFSQPDYLCKAP